MNQWKYAFLLLILLRIFWSFWFPVTADEAYFWQWGHYPDWTYYDHGPITGWWMWLSHQISDQSIGVARLTHFVAQILIAYLLVSFVVKTKGETQKISLLFLLSTPAWAFNFIFSTDTPLFFFALLSVIFYLKFLEKNQSGFLILTGFLLGLGLWSKYLIILTVFGIGTHVLVTQKTKQILSRIGCLLIGFLPLMMIHVYLAQNNCWWPLQFNLFNRQNSGGGSWSNLLSALVLQFILIPPWFLLKWYQLRKSSPALDSHSFAKQNLTWLFLSSFLLLILLSYKESGLHWGLSIVPLFYLLFLNTDFKIIKSLLKYNLAYSAFIYIILLAATLSLPLWYQKERYYADYVLGRHGLQVHQTINHIAQELKITDPRLGTMGYTTAALLHYASHTPYLSFKDTSPHGRNADLWQSYPDYQGENFMILSTYAFSEAEKNEFKSYFESTHYQNLEVQGGQFYLLIGQGFHSQNYQNQYQTWAKKQFYQFPDRLKPISHCSIFPAL